MRVGSLFSGIGGLDLGLERAGMTVVWQSEIDPYASRVLAKHWPHVPNLGDITTIDWSGVEPVDLICGGYPCQPFSLAGSRAGTTDARHLWPYFADAIRELRPRFALLENVPGHLSMGFGQVHSDLADLGYDTGWDCIPAAAVGAPHLRYRVFVVADADGAERGAIPEGRDELNGHDAGRQEASGGLGGDGQERRRRSLADADRRGLARLAQAQRQRREVHSDEHGLVDSRRRGEGVADADRSPWDTSRSAGEAVSRPASIQRLGRRSSGERGPWTVEPDVGRVAHGVPSRVDRLKCLGNAVVPQVAEWVGRRIMEAAA